MRCPLPHLPMKGAIFETGFLWNGGQSRSSEVTDMREDVLAIFERDGTPGEILDALMPAFARALNCERCVMFLRDPKTDRGRALHRWAAKPEFALRREDRGWEPMPATLLDDDPMYAEAMVNPEALYIEDIETADPALLNVAYEREHFGHRALVHAPVWHKGEMYGVLEPSSMTEPRKWSDADRALVAAVQASIGPVVAAFVRADAG
jgi:GAF domain-containing protein